MDDTCLHDFESHVAGKNARVRIYPDRIEWGQKGKVSKGKAALGAMTVGISLAATGVRTGGSTEMIPIKAITSVTTEKDGLRNYKVKLIASGNTVDMRVSKTEAEVVKDTLTRLMLGSHPTQQQPAVQTPAAPAPMPEPAPSPVASAPDPIEQIKKLGELRDAGLMTDDEFTEKRNELLNRM
jgi:hypothetical protein